MLSYIYPHILLTGVNFFDMYDQYPVVKSSSKRDLFVKYQKSATIQVVTNIDFESSCEDEDIYGDSDALRFEKLYHINDAIDYPKILKHIELQTNTQLAPLYIKKPNIS
jgi:hypothetical protein